jgi:G patch domain/KOW motif-containing protein
MQNKPPGWHDIENEEEKFKHELKYRPAESQDEDYERVPVEDFGEALLRGMGWQPGTAVGKGGFVAFFRLFHLSDLIPCLPR